MALQGGSSDQASPNPRPRLKKARCKLVCAQFLLQPAVPRAHTLEDQRRLSTTSPPAKHRKQGGPRRSSGRVVLTNRRHQAIPPCRRLVLTALTYI